MKHCKILHRLAAPVFSLALAALVPCIPAHGTELSGDYGEDAYGYLQYIAANLPERTNEENNRSENLNQAGLWIRTQLESYGYEVTAHDYEHTGYGYSGTNYCVTKPGTSEDIIVVGGHYDSVHTAGIDDNGSGVSVLLELAKRFSQEDTPCTLQFVFYDNEEFGGYVGSYYYVNDYLKGNHLLDKVLCSIVIDSVAGGDRLYGYGGDYEEDGRLVRQWVYEEAMRAAGEAGTDLHTLPAQVEMYRTPTRPVGSDNYYYNTEGIPYLYLEASLWCNDDGTGGNDDTRLTCHYQTANEAFAATGGQIMHTEFDRLDRLNELLPGRVQSNLSAVCALVSTMLREITPDTPAAVEALAGEASKEDTERATAENALPSGETVSEETSGRQEETVSEETSGCQEETVIRESSHRFIMGILLITGTVTVLLLILLLWAAVTSRSRRRKRMKRRRRKLWKK